MNMNKIKQTVNSRTIWVLVFLFVLNGIDGIRNQIDPQALFWIDFILTGFASYFKINPSQKYGEERKD